MKNKELKKEIIEIFKKFGLSENHASISTDALINAELVGAYGHGLSRLKMYCDRIKKRVINSRPKIKIKTVGSKAKTGSWKIKKIVTSTVVESPNCFNC